MKLAKTTLRMLLASAVCAIPTHSQAPSGTQPSFGEASIKPSGSEANRRTPGASSRAGFVASSEFGPQLLSFTKISVSTLIVRAYGVKYYQVSGGPSWLVSDQWDIVVKSDHPSTLPEKYEMLKALLSDRFRLQFHQERRDLPVYALVIAKTGSKLTPTSNVENHTSSSQDCSDQTFFSQFFSPCARLNGRGELTIENGTVTNLASKLSDIVGVKVVDNTMLTGNYDMALKWTADNYQLSPLRPNSDPKGATLFTALQEQL